MKSEGLYQIFVWTKNMMNIGIKECYSEMLKPSVHHARNIYLKCSSFRVDDHATLFAYCTAPAMPYFHFILLSLSPSLSPPLSEWHSVF